MRIATTSDWQLLKPITPLPANVSIRARGRTASAAMNGSPGLIEELSALQKLKEGNRRYADGKVIHPNQSSERRKEVAAGQHPFALLVGCADSRVPPEIAFDQGLGDLFVVRNAGEVLDNSSLGSIEYAVEHLHVPLIVVLGHERCGAVEAAVHYDPKQTPAPHLPEHVLYLVNAIKPNVVQGANEEETLELSVKQNARKVALEIRSELDREHLDKDKQISIVTGYYDLDTGKVMFYQ
jgi:carbonic anhydrase